MVIKITRIRCAKAKFLAFHQKCNMPNYFNTCYNTLLLVEVYCNYASLED